MHRWVTSGSVLSAALPGWNGTRAGFPCAVICPQAGSALAFNIVWRGAKLHVEVTHAGITVTHRGGSAVEITVDGHPVKLAAE